MIPSLMLPAIVALDINPMTETLFQQISSGGYAEKTLKPKLGYAYVIYSVRIGAPRLSDGTRLSSDDITFTYFIGSRRGVPIPLVESAHGLELNLFVIATRRDPFRMRFDNGYTDTVYCDATAEYLEVPEDKVLLLKDYMRMFFEKVIGR